MKPHRSGSTLAQVMAWCRQAPSHYLNQCWLIKSELRSCGIQLRAISPENACVNNYPCKELENDKYKIAAASARGQWVNHNIKIETLPSLSHLSPDIHSPRKEQREIDLKLFQLWGWSCPAYILTLKQLGNYFQNITLFPQIIPYKCIISVWAKTMYIQSELWILMVLKHQDISSYSAEYAHLHFQLLMG